MAENKKLQVGYLGIRGRVQGIRFLLEYAGIPYENIIYADHEEWHHKKATLGMPFPNIPYLFDGDFKLSQTDAILVYIAEISGKADELLGKTPKDRAFN